MDSKKALTYAAIALAILIGVSVLVSVVSAILSLAWAVVSGIVTLALLVGVAYVAYRAGSWLFGGDDASVDADPLGDSWSSSTSSSDVTESPQDRLRRQYVEGQIDEAEFERRLASELEANSTDEIDRELERER
ncbi:hypothetical protein [Halorubrum sp. SY-15]|uniref:hypothetical protein n=1 Tax=Halorubrum sp. SY-15 TaxID=3402277 RepID=UPI003EBBC8BD